jgi:hypothetical protein
MLYFILLLLFNIFSLTIPDAPRAPQPTYATDYDNGNVLTLTLTPSNSGPATLSTLVKTKTKKNKNKKTKVIIFDQPQV